MIEERMEVKKIRGRPRIILLDDIIAYKTWSSVELRTENVWETGCLVL